MDSERLTPYLRRRCLALRIEDRVALLGALRESLTGSARTEADKATRLEHMVEVMEQLTGLELRRRTRMPDYVRARTVFAFTARQEGFSQKVTGAFLGQDHSTVVASEKRMRSAFAVPAMYADYINLYNDFTNAIL